MRPVPGKDLHSQPGGSLGGDCRTVQDLPRASIRLLVDQAHLGRAQR